MQPHAVTSIRVLSALIGIFTVLAAFFWAAVTLMAPDTDPPWLTRIVFRASRNVLHGLTRIMQSNWRRSALRTLYIPFSLLAIVACSLILTAIGYTFLFYGVSEDSLSRSYVNSISSISVLGIGGLPGSRLQTTIAGIEAFTGPVFVALLISYIAGMHSTINQQRASVRMLNAGIGRATNGIQLLEIAAAGQGLASLSNVWASWAANFDELDKTYRTVEGYLLFFSANMASHWTIDTLTVLDAANLRNTITLRSPDMQAAHCLESGTLIMSHVASHFDHHVLSFKPQQMAIHVSRDDFEALCDRLASGGEPVIEDLEGAWTQFESSRRAYVEPIARVERMLITPERQLSLKL